MEFKAKIDRLIYSGNNNFKIYAVTDLDNITKTNEYNNTSILGSLPSLQIGKEYNIDCEEKYDEKRKIYNYKVNSIERDVDINDTKDQVEFLKEFMSINKAQSLVDCNPNVLSLLINDKIKDIDISCVYGVGEKTLIKAAQKCKENFELMPLKKMFKGELNINMLKKMKDEFKSSELIKEKMETEPYQTLVSVSRIGFKIADTIIKKLIKSDDIGINIDKSLLVSPDRTEQFINFLLNENEKNGNSCMILDELKEKIRNQMPECYKFVDSVLEKSQYNKENKFISLTKTYNQESYIWERIYKYFKEKRIDNFKDVDRFRDIDGFKATDKQFSLLPIISKNVISVLCGYSGSGKSTSMKMLVNMLKKHNKEFMLFAPTGKASRVLKKYTKEESYTIHRGLGYNPKQGWEYNENNKIDTDFVIVDEFSMVDIDLCFRLFSAIDFEKTKLLLVGDPEQLPSVGKGNLLHEFINCKLVPIIMLDEIFRYGIGGLTTVGTNLRMSKKYLKYNQTKIEKIGQDNGYIFIPCNQDNILQTVSGLYKKLIDKGVDRSDILVLSAQNKGKIGTYMLNKTLKPISNINYESKKSYMDFHIGDIVIQVRINNYKAMSKKEYENNVNKNECSTLITNGDTGEIIDIVDNYVVIKFEDYICYYNEKEMKNVDFAYAISSHKSQGSEAKIVIYITDKSHTFMTDANLMYVSVTRAKNKCFHIGSSQTINNKIKYKTNRNRLTNSNMIINNLIRSDNFGK